MSTKHRTPAAAHAAFEKLAAQDPRLWNLWDLAQSAAPPKRNRSEDEECEPDPYEVDEIAEGKPDDGWCAEDFFHTCVKPALFALADSTRMGEPHILQDAKVIYELYFLLLDWA